MVVEIGKFFFNFSSVISVKYLATFSKDYLLVKINLPSFLGLKILN